MENWHQLQSTVDIVSRVANQALRAQRILMAKRLLHMEEMIKIHGPALRKLPGGEARMNKIQAEFTKARRMILQGKLDG